MDRNIANEVYSFIFFYSQLWHSACITSTTIRFISLRRPWNQSSSNEIIPTRWAGLMRRVKDSAHTFSFIISQDLLSIIAHICQGSVIV